ncbi:hypothetical protein BWGOE8_08640 [Bacillus mycoides]|uniref:Preprotein translocase subunit SecA n=2 Tax=Bacillus cereus group TaxID=86661 RepID=A0A2C1DXJ2_BACCE|nr:hypothetical protein BWGOE9_08480 [Bacillus mycoides]OFD84078.1 hypothetical protein BWGOE8_08640 [Bacillus mycoides]OFD86269.1 hypothetical protein BWGOE10_08560 [Bacillus mycoides]PGT04911.1 preprotein translocase subunit SecA [Bacillus cereus]
MLNSVKNSRISLSLENEILKRFAYEEVEKVEKSDEIGLIQPS